MLPEKQRFYVAELATYVARETCCTVTAAKSRLYRGIEAGQIRAVKVTGMLMIPAPEAQRILTGDHHV